MTDYLELNNCPIIRKENQSQDQIGARNLGSSGRVGFSVVRYFGTMMIDAFGNRLDKVLIDTHTDCFACALMPNHMHLMLQAADVPIATVVQRRLTGYAVGFNRHR